MNAVAHLDGGEDPGFRRRDTMARFFGGPVCLPAKQRVARASACWASQRSRLATTRPRGQLGASRLATAVAGASREEWFRAQNVGTRTAMRRRSCSCVCRSKPGHLAPQFPYTLIAGTRPRQSSPECQVAFRCPARTSLPDPGAAQPHSGEITQQEKAAVKSLRRSVTRQHPNTFPAAKHQNVRYQQQKR